MIGTQIGRYRIDDELGRGGMGVVYRGTQITLDRTVAIKMLPAHLADADNQERFRREALTLARLAHPNIVHIYDVEEQDGHSFIMMEHIGGGSLGDRMRAESPFSAARAVEIMAPVLSALQAAHLAGVVHRDIKPDNILFTETGRPKLTDFGIAHLRDSGSKTRTGVMLGTPYYMSPEQAQGRSVTAAADLYAVGVVLYEMLAGRVPFTGEDPLSVALKHVQETPVSLEELRPDLPPALCALVHRALLKDPDSRFVSAAAMQDALESGSWWAMGRSTMDPGRTATPAAGAVVDSGAHPAATSGAHLSGTRDVGAGASGSGALTAAVPGDDPMATSGAAGTGVTPRPTTGRFHGLAEVLSTSTSQGIATASKAGRHTLRWLATPGWRGYPRAVWTGAAALLLALTWAGAQTIGGSPDSPGTPVTGGGESGVTSPVDRPGPAASAPFRPGGDDESSSESSAGGGGSPITVPRIGPSITGGPARAPLSAEERAALGDLVRGGTGEEAAPPDPAPTSPTTGILERIPTNDPGRVNPADLQPPQPDPQPDPQPEAEAESPAPYTLVRAIVDRQLRAVEQGNRAAFLQDFHPAVRAEAAAEFDLAASAATNIRSTISNLSIEFLGPDRATVTFDVVVTFTVRADGRTARESYGEEWSVRREGDRWWIIEWN